ncbi:MAG: hypothetical protein Q9163_002411 [Psora crenata]
MLGRTTLNISKSSSSFLQDIEKSVQKEVNSVVGDVAKALNIHDFYSAHVLDYCEGYYTPGPVANLTEDPSKNVTHCSNRTAFFHFDPSLVIQSELKPGVKLTDLKWPRAIQDGIKAIVLASKVMFFLYCIGVAATGLAFIGACLGIFAGSRLSAMVNLMVSMIAVLALFIASCISTGAINQLCDTINEHGNDIGVFADKGNTFIGMTWAATVLVMLAGAVWTLEVIRGRKQLKETQRELEEKQSQLG